MAFSQMSRGFVGGRCRPHLGRPRRRRRRSSTLSNSLRSTTRSASTAVRTIKPSDRSIAGSRSTAFRTRRSSTGKAKSPRSAILKTCSQRPADLPHPRSDFSTPVSHPITACNRQTPAANESIQAAAKTSRKQKPRARCSLATSSRRAEKILCNHGYFSCIQGRECFNEATRRRRGRSEN